MKDLQRENRLANIQASVNQFNSRRAKIVSDETTPANAVEDKDKPEWPKHLNLSVPLLQMPQGRALKREDGKTDKTVCDWLLELLWNHRDRPGEEALQSRPMILADRMQRGAQDCVEVWKHDVATITSVAKQFGIGWVVFGILKEVNPKELE